MRRGALGLLALFAAGCVDTEGTPPQGSGGTLVIATAADADNLVPVLTATLTGTQITDLVYDRLADIGDSLNIIGDGGFTPRLADRWAWGPDSLTISFHIDPRALWHDGRPVTAGDVRFTHVALKDSTLGSGAGSLLTNIDSVTAPDSSTAIFWFRSRAPQQFYDAVYQTVIMPEHIWKGIAPSAWRSSPPARAPVGSGQFRFVRWTPKGSIEIAADTANYRGAPKLSRVIWSIAPDFNSAVTRILSGEADFFEAPRPETLVEVAKNPQLRTKSYRGLDYIFAQFNLRDPANRTRPHPLFGDRELRRALTMAVDRKAIVQSLYDTLALPALGPTIRTYVTTDPNLPQIPFDPQRARQVLDSLGWKDADGDGIRERGGKPLQFTVSVPGSSQSRVRMAVLLQEQLRQAGVKVNVDRLDFPVMVDRQRKRTFDMVINSWHTQPSPGGVRQSWGTIGSRARNGTNYSSYENPVFDAYVDSALMAGDIATRRALFTKAYETIIQDAPAIWIAEPLPTVAYHSRLVLAPLRPDAWWAHIADWWIPPEKRIARDHPPSPAAGTPDQKAP